MYIHENILFYLQCGAVLRAGVWVAGLLGSVPNWPRHMVQICNFGACISLVGKRHLLDKSSSLSLSPQHFTELLDELDVLGQLLNDPFLSEKNEMMEVELSPASPAPLIQAEHSYSLCGDSRPQSPLTHVSTDDNFNQGNGAVDAF